MIDRLAFDLRDMRAFALAWPDPQIVQRVVARLPWGQNRRVLAAEYGSKRRISAERVDSAEVASIVAEAARARNGWKAILARCAPTTTPRSALQLARNSSARSSPR